jgi:hypothetical protein
MENKELPIATDEECIEIRKNFIKNGIIVPLKQPYRKINASQIPEEGMYKRRPIRNNREYMLRKKAYFEMLQSLLKARKELKLEFQE